MDEAEWLSSDDPARMVAFLMAGRCPGVQDWPRATDRKLWLFVSAVERLWWGDKVGKGGRKSCDLVEAVADGRAAPDALGRAVFSYTMPRRAPECAAECVRTHNSPGDPPRWAALLRDIFGNPWRPLEPEECYLDGHYCRTHGRDLVFVSPALYRCPAGRAAFRARLATPAAQGIARRAYGGYDFAALPILADALEEAGCEEQSLLIHLRGWELCPRCFGTLHYHHPVASQSVQQCTLCWDDTADWPVGRIPLRGPHARGCFCLDLILGKS